ncbi:Leukemia inhibitory factor receptor [Bagarius yarrelli]|uniref:Leukemia inhibitory factor receptor n=1 Tax=Bagarius yarrelli TaxID=175774 RepID=A0A556VCS7_BAGYA|nr:Leukemia inhibitory factor receptor [Bagarius yarrelli]
MELVHNETVYVEADSKKNSRDWLWHSAVPLECTSRSVRIRARHADAVSKWSPLLTVPGKDVPDQPEAQMFPQDRVLEVGGNVTVCCITPEGVAFSGLGYGKQSLAVNRLSRRTYSATITELQKSHYTGSNAVCLSDTGILTGTVLFIGLRLLAPVSVMSESEAWQGRVGWSWTVEAYHTLSLLCEVQLDSGGNVQTRNYTGVGLSSVVLDRLWPDTEYSFSIRCASLRYFWRWGDWSAPYSLHTQMDRTVHGAMTAYEVSQRDGEKDVWTTVSVPPSVSNTPISFSNSSDVIVAVAARNLHDSALGYVVEWVPTCCPNSSSCTVQWERVSPSNTSFVIQSDKEGVVPFPGEQKEGKREDDDDDEDYEDDNKQHVEMDTDSDEPALLRYYNQLVSDTSDCSSSSTDSGQTQVTYTGIQSPAYHPQNQHEALFEAEPHSESPGVGYRPQCSWRPDSPENENFCESLGSPTSVTSSQFLIPESSEERPESLGNWFQNLLSSKF